MNAVEFVKKFGWERATELLKECPVEMPYIGRCGFSKTEYNDFVCKDNLKTLVDAWELVEKRGGLSKAKEIEQQYWNSGVGCAMFVAMELKQAITLVESCND